MVCTVPVPFGNPVFDGLWLSSGRRFVWPSSGRDSFGPCLADSLGFCPTWEGTRLAFIWETHLAFRPVWKEEEIHLAFVSCQTNPSASRLHVTSPPATSAEGL